MFGILSLFLAVSPGPIFASLNSGLVKRGEEWARPVSLQGVPNTYEVMPGLYWGCQPTDEGFEQLRKFGIKTVVSLRSFLWVRTQVRGHGLEFEQIPMKTWHPEEEDVIRFLQIGTEPARMPIFVFCRKAFDRTGVMIAAYRIVVEGWSKDEAIVEMTKAPMISIECGRG